MESMNATDRWMPERCDVWCKMPKGARRGVCGSGGFADRFIANKVGDLNSLGPRTLTSLPSGAADTGSSARLRAGDVAELGCVAPLTLGTVLGDERRCSRARSLDL